MATPQQPESTAIATTERAALPDLNRPANLVKFAGFWEGKKLERLKPEDQSFFLATLGQHIGVRAELGEIILYQGKPYITIDGRLRVAHETGLLDGLQVRPATQMEFQNYGAETGDMLWVCYVFKKGARRAYTGWGHVRKDDRNPVSKTHPRELAKKRAKYDALRTAFPPKEAIGEMHTRYIEDAEATVRTVHNTGVAALQAGSYDCDELPDDAGVVGEEIAADAVSTTAPVPVQPTREDPYAIREETPPPPDDDDEILAGAPDDARSIEESDRRTAAQLALDDRRPARRNNAVRDGGR